MPGKRIKPTFKVFKDSEDGTSYIFTSKDYKTNEVTKKAVVFNYYAEEDIYILGFGRVDEDGKVDFDTLTNNGDALKVFNTVLDIIDHFFLEKPNAIVFITGSCERRTRLYNNGLRVRHKYFQELGYEIAGDFGTGFEEYDPNKNYLGFYIKRF